MVPLMDLWLPILLSSVIVFLVSSVLHMVFKHHNSDFQKVSSEDQVMSDLRKANLSPGDYVLPHTTDNKVRNSQEFKDKMNQGPVVMMTVFPSGQTGMGASLTLWFLFSLVVGIFSAYIAGHALPAGSNYLSVFRFTGTTAFIGYGLALVHDSIWYKRKWSTTFKFIFDGLIYALFTAGVFGWLWPAM